jgi:hypothetical protein
MFDDLLEHRPAQKVKCTSVNAQFVAKCAPGASDNSHKQEGMILYIGVRSGQFAACAAALAQCRLLRLSAAEANSLAVQPIISRMTPEARNPPSTAIHWPVT